jgi:hypothetical protein
MWALVLMQGGYVCDGGDSLTFTLYMMSPPSPFFPGPIKGKEVLRPRRQLQPQIEESKRGLSKRDQELRDRKAYLKKLLVCSR